MNFSKIVFTLLVFGGFAAAAENSFFAGPANVSPVIGFGQENFTFELTDFGVKGKSAKFEPNVAGILRLGLNAWGFGFGYSFRGSAKDIDTQKGSTDFSDWQLGYHDKSWGVEGYYQTYDGFYTSNTNAIQTYPGVSFKHVGIAGRYALEDGEFSVGALVDQSQEIKSTSGKYYLMGGLHQYQMHTDVPVLQQEFAGVNPEFENLRTLNAFSVSVGPGAGKYWVLPNRFFAGAMLEVLGTYANYQYSSTTGQDSASELTGSFNVKLAFGYTGPEYRSGISINSDSRRLKAPGGYILASSNRVLIYLRRIF